MGLQINIPMTSRSGFAVPSGTYVWILEKRGGDFKYGVEAGLVFYKDKASLDGGLQRYFPAEVPDSMHNFYQVFSASAFASLTSMAVHTFCKTQLETVLGVGTITIVQ